MKREKRKFKKKEKKKNGWSKKTTRNCFFNEHFNIENDIVEHFKIQQPIIENNKLKEENATFGPRSS